MGNKIYKKDNYNCKDCTNCKDCYNCKNLYSCVYCNKCKNCNNCTYCNNCKNCYGLVDEVDKKNLYKINNKLYYCSDKNFIQSNLFNIDDDVLVNLEIFHEILSY